MSIPSLPGARGRRPARRPGDNDLQPDLDPDFELMALRLLLTKIDDDLGKAKNKKDRELISRKTEVIRSSLDNSLSLSKYYLRSLKKIYKAVDVTWKTFMNVQNRQTCSNFIDSLEDLILFFNR